MTFIGMIFLKCMEIILLLAAATLLTLMQVGRVLAKQAVKAFKLHCCNKAYFCISYGSFIWSCP